MNGKTKLLLGIVLVSLMLGSIPYSAQPVTSTKDSIDIAADNNSEVSMPGVEASYQNGRAILNASKITIQVAGGGNVPHFHFWPTGDKTNVYHAKFMHLAEYNDTNGDGAFQYNETVKTTQGNKLFAFPSAAPSWEFSGFYNITQEEETIGFGFNFSMSGGSRKPIYSELAINITNRFYIDTVEDTLTAGDESASFTVEGLAALKTNIWVHNWQFEDSDNQLALRWDISQDGDTEARVDGKPKDFSKKMDQAEKVQPDKGKQVSVNFKHSQRGNVSFKVPNVVKTKTEFQEQLQKSYVSARTDGTNLRMFMSAPATDGTIIYDPITETSLEDDTTDPTITIDSPTADATVSTKDVTVEWSGSDAESGISYYAVKLDDGTWEQVGTDTSYTYTGLEDGTYTVTVKAVDNAGNSATDTISFTVKTKTGFAGLSPIMLAGIGVAVIVIIGMATYIIKRR